MAELDLAWAVGHYRRNLIRAAAGERQALAFLSYDRTRLGEPLKRTPGVDYLETNLAGRAEELERAVDDLDGWLTVVGINPTALSPRES